MAIEKIENEVVGQYMSREASYILTSPTGTSQAYSLDNLHSIDGIKSIHIFNGSNIHIPLVDAVVSWSGNTLTIADGAATYDHSDSTTIYRTAFGKRKV